MTLLEKIVRLEQEAAEFGFRWERADQIMAQIQSEVIEVNEHLNTERPNDSALQEEIGDLLHAAFSLCVFCKFNPEETLQLSIEKFERRLQAVKAIAQELQLTNLQEQSFTQLMTIWNQAKSRVG